jgi:hypothetical protein
MAERFFPLVAMFADEHVERGFQEWIKTAQRPGVDLCGMELT